ncbi:2-methylthioadenine synthetase [Methanococcoides methylutens]|uniref:tRNA-t(6)A37 methylthiotransferase n=1 Tax=Methanococcoides methylutens TaxID=2226 RepID=A0A099SZ27_METMT|nr:tRNA (N(6)-L-threonylcarbamoyladenosine(37)-C(2))-methylthiotransferase [Methanococcoides methylutens]KGK98140.1 2-methylthioadenine synthetase [Methanococcoides methylutens]
MKVHVLTYGCSANQASSEIMIASVRGLGHELVDEKDADVVVINTCTVKYATEQKILFKIEDLGHKGVDVVVTGCMPQVQLEAILEKNPDAHILGVNSIAKIGKVLNVIDDSRNGGSRERVQLLSTEPEGFLKTAHSRFNPNIHICQISQGCDYSCAYCIVTIARGKLRSFDADSIVEDVRMAVSEGCREIWLTSQDNGQYGTDRDVLLPELLRRIVAIPGNFKVRVGMMNPFSVTPIIDDLIEVFRSDKIYKILHLPIQSASDDVLKRMNRFHSIEETNVIIARFKEVFPELTIFTDIIVGFPGETDEDFDRTLEWVKEIRPDKVNISRYTPRPLTKALEYRNIDSRIVVNRSNKLHLLCDEVKLGSKQKMVGWKGEVFVSMDAKVKGVMARTASYKPVVIPEGSVQPGSSCNVEIYDTTSGYFLARLID